MRVMIALVRREFLEHRMAFAGAPLIIGVTMLVVILLALSAGNISISARETTSSGSSLFETDSPVSAIDLLSIGLDRLAGAPPQERRQLLQRVRGAIATPFVIVCLIVGAFYFAGALYDERRDGSLFFYKSLPVADTHALVSKLIAGLLIAPWIYVAAILAMYLAVLLIVTALSAGANFSAAGIWGSFGFLDGIGHLLFAHVTYALMVLPVAAWFLLVSSYVNRGPLLVAVLVPAIPIVVESIVLRSDYVGAWIIGHVGLERFERPASIGAVYADPTLYSGLGVAVVLLLVALHFRRTRNTT